MIPGLCRQLYPITCISRWEYIDRFLNETVSWTEELKLTKSAKSETLVNAAHYTPSTVQYTSVSGQVGVRSQAGVVRYRTACVPFKPPQRIQLSISVNLYASPLPPQTCCPHLLLPAVLSGYGHKQICGSEREAQRTNSSRHFPFYPLFSSHLPTEMFAVTVLSNIVI